MTSSIKNFARESENKIYKKKNYRWSMFLVILVRFSSKFCYFYLLHIHDCFHCNSNIFKIPVCLNCLVNWCQIQFLFKFFIKYQTLQNAGSKIGGQLHSVFGVNLFDVLKLPKNQVLIHIYKTKLYRGSQKSSSIHINKTITLSGSEAEFCRMPK